MSATDNDHVPTDLFPFGERSIVNDESRKTRWILIPGREEPLQPKPVF
jgi:hypothetical protein